MHGSAVSWESIHSTDSYQNTDQIGFLGLGKPQYKIESHHVSTCTLHLPIKTHTYGIRHVYKRPSQQQQHVEMIESAISPV